MSLPDPLPPLILRCRILWKSLYGAAAIALLALGTAALAGDGDAGPGAAGVLSGLVLLAFGSGCAHFFLRYCLSRLELSDRGFRLRGPFRSGALVSWGEVVDWRRDRGAGGPASLRVIHGPERRRLSVPLIYEDGHLLEIGLGLRRFPVV